jgi:predicted MFS family arabinose efflux permease
MNVHAIEVERAAQRPLMSGFHAMWSVGGLAGSALLTFLLSIRFSTLVGTMLCAALMAGAMIVAWPRLLRATRRADGPLFALPRGIVLALAVLAAITFLVEGAVLDWSALVLTEDGLVSTAQGGLGYVLFSIAMTAGRLSGDAVTARVGDRATLFWGGLLSVSGFVVLLTAPFAALALAGFVLIGLGASNIVPVLFRRAGDQRVMPAGMAVAAITTIAYAGVLAGPAAVGFVAQGVGLPMAFWMLAALLVVVPLSARPVTAPR